MRIHSWMRILAVIALGALAVFCAACGGDGETTVPTIQNQIDTGSNNVPGLQIDGPTQYEGQEPAPAPTLPDPSTTPVETDTPFDFGQNIFMVPLDTNGAGRVVVDNFSPGQKIALIMANLNPAYRDAHMLPGDLGFPPLPSSSFSVFADLIEKGVMAAPADAIPTTEVELLALDDSTVRELGAPTVDPAKIYEREAQARGLEPYAALAPTKTASVIQKGEIRTFIYVQPRPGWPPKPIPPDPEDPDQDTSQFDWPTGYNAQHGRLVAIGAHCLIFLTTAVNDGHPDAVQFTEARLNAMAREFDTVIYPTATAAFGPVLSYREEGIWRWVERYLDPPITGADYGSNGEFLRTVPGEPDSEMEQEARINIFIYDGEAGGFYVGAQQVEESEYGEPHSVGSTIYIASDNYPANSAAWEAAYSVMAHEFQHKLYNDHGLPTRPIEPRGGNYNWLNEGLSQLDIHLCGYTVNSGRIIPWAIDGQLTSYLENVNLSAVCMDGNGQFPVAQQTQYGNGFLFFLYLYEHYPAGIGKRIYELASKGETDYIKLIEYATGESFDQTYAKFGICNFIDGIYKDNDTDLFDPDFHYDTIDLRGTINLATGTIVLPGVRTDVFPDMGGYPVEAIDRPVIPWAFDYVIFSNGDGRDLEFTVYSDPYFKMFLLPVTFNASTNKVDVTPGIVMNY